MCSEVNPENPTIRCDMEWIHQFTHGNMHAGVFWRSPRTQSASQLRWAKILEIRKAVEKHIEETLQSSD